MRHNDMFADGTVVWRVVDTRKTDLTVHNGVGTDSLNPMSQSAVTEQLTNLQRQIDGTPTNAWSQNINERLAEVESVVTGTGIDSVRQEVASLADSARASLQSAINSLGTTVWTKDQMWIE